MSRTKVDNEIQLMRPLLKNAGLPNGRDRYQWGWEVRVKTDSSRELGAGQGNESAVRDIALWRIYLLRAGYLLIAVGMGWQMIPAFITDRGS